MVDMKIQKNLMSVQLKETSQLTGDAGLSGWSIPANGRFGSHKLNAQNRSAIMGYIHTQAVEGWLNGAMTGQTQPLAFCPAIDRTSRLQIYVFRTR